MEVENYVVKDAVNFALIGAFNTGVDYAILTLGQAFGLSLFWAVGLGYMIGGLSGYIMNTKWTYRRHNHSLKVSGAAKYVAISFVGLFLTEVIVYVITAKLGYSVPVGKLFAVGTVFFWNFFGNRMVTFRHANNAPSKATNASA